MRLQALIAAVGVVLTAGLSPAQSTSTSSKFDFGGQAAAGYTSVSPTTTYTKDRGYGFEPGAQVARLDHNGSDPLRDGFCTNDKPFYFSVAVPEGNYRVTVTLGDAAGGESTTPSRPARRLMLKRSTRLPASARRGRSSSTSARRRSRPAARSSWDRETTTERCLMRS